MTIFHLSREGRPSLIAPPAQIRTGALTHTALTLDEWRQSAHRDKDAEYGVGESTGSRQGRDDAIAHLRVDCGELEGFAPVCKRDD
jgi:hypothetical protein